MEYLRSKQTKHGWDILLMNGDKARKLASFATMREADEYARGLIKDKHDTHSRKTTTTET
jgi:hypothetical protein